jgi:hypothetical protein
MRVKSGGMVGYYAQGLKSIGNMGALLPGRIPLARKVDYI